MLITCALRSHYFSESVVARKNRRYVQCSLVLCGKPSSIISILSNLVFSFLSEYLKVSSDHSSNAEGENITYEAIFKDIMANQNLRRKFYE